MKVESSSLRERRSAPTRKFVGRGGDCSASERHFFRYDLCGGGSVVMVVDFLAELLVAVARQRPTGRVLYL